MDRGDPDQQIIMAARRRHVRMHSPGALEESCELCIGEVTQAARDLGVPQLWEALDNLFTAVTDLRRETR